MPTSTYDLLASNVLSTAANSVSFTNLSGSYRDLVCVVDPTSANPDSFFVRFNSDSGSNYAFVRATYDGATLSSFASETQNSIGLPSFNQTYSARMLHYFYIFDYASTDKHKLVLSRYNSGVDDAYRGVAMNCSRWSNTAAITSISFTCSSENFAIGSRFRIYGIVS